MRILCAAIAALALTTSASAQPAQNANVSADALAAQLVSAQAELATSPQAGRDHLLAVLASAESRTDVNVPAYRAAMALGAWALGERQFDVAHRAWAAALSHAVGPSLPALLARNRARTSDAVTLIAEYAHAPSAAARDRAYEALQQAATELHPFALQEGASTEVGPFQTSYAEAIGWRDYGRAAYTPRPTAPMHDVSGAVVCPTTWHGNDDILRSLTLAYAGPPGFAVFRILTDSSGAVASTDVAYAQPAQDLPRMLRVFSRLRVERASDAPANCVMPRVVFQPIVMDGGNRPNRLPSPE